MGDFTERIDELLDRVGDGRLRGTVTVDQVYAKYQLLREDLQHSVGNSHYLSRPLNEKYPEYFQRMADKVLDSGGIVSGMVDSCESLANSAATQTPVELFNLARSGSVVVRDQGSVVYRRPAQQGRLSDQELRQLRRGKKRRRR